MSSLVKVIIILTISLFANGTCLEEENGAIGHRVVKTKLGAVRGNTHAVLNSIVDVFWSIPFAKPPVGPLRFKHPVRVDAWNGTLDGTRKPNACYQYKNAKASNKPLTESEDCLFLNIYVPKSNNIHADIGYDNINFVKTRLPVMFYIHGGDFLRGATTLDLYNGSMLSVTNDVIVVTVGYRLGAFGFLFSGTPEAPGNAGLFDQLMALQWVHDNIECFGGDPESVTVFGTSTGAFSVGLMIVSPLSRNLFQRAILMSGAPGGFDAMSTSIVNSLLIIEKLGNFTGCNRFNNVTITEIVTCLAVVSAEMLDLAVESFYGFYRPVLDGYFFTSVLTNLYDEAVKKNISVIVGVTQDEGGQFLLTTLNCSFEESENISCSHELLINIINNMLDLRFNVDGLHRFTINYVYSNMEDIHDNDANRQAASEFLGDCTIVCPVNEFAQQLSDRNIDVYYFVFDHRPSNTPFPEWAGVAHGEESTFVFGQPMVLTDNFTTEESRLSYRIVNTLGNFAKYGVPSYKGVSWPRYCRKNQMHLSLGIHGDVIGKNFRTNYCAFWKNIPFK